MNTKTRSKDIQARAMELVEIRPMSDEANTLISRAMDEHGFPDRVAAYQFLRTTGALHGVDVGGEIVNQQQAVGKLVEEFGCHPNTAKSHVAKAGRRKRHPDWTPPGRGGYRAGARRPRKFIIDVYNGRATVSKYINAGVGILQYTAAVNWEELEEQAATAVTEQGGAINISGHYRCPPELAEAAVWDEVDDADAE